MNLECQDLSYRRLSIGLRCLDEMLELVERLIKLTFIVSTLYSGIILHKKNLEDE